MFGVGFDVMAWQTDQMLNECFYFDWLGGLIRSNLSLTVLVPQTGDMREQSETTWFHSNELHVICDAVASEALQYMEER